MVKRTIDTLNTLDDRILHDIGLHRSEIEFARAPPADAAIGKSKDLRNAEYLKIQERVRPHADRRCAALLRRGRL